MGQAIPGLTAVDRQQAGCIDPPLGPAGALDPALVENLEPGPMEKAAVGINSYGADIWHGFRADGLLFPEKSMAVEAAAEMERFAAAAKPQSAGGLFELEAQRHRTVAHGNRLQHLEICKTARPALGQRGETERHGDAGGGRHIAPPVDDGVVEPEIVSAVEDPPVRAVLGAVTEQGP